MDLPKYKFRRNTELHYDFVSVGRKGTIIKRVIFQETEKFGFFNMALGDLDTKTGDLDYYSITDNGDRDTVLATISAICEDILKLYPQHSIYFKGTTTSRNRLFQMAIAHYFDELCERFHILGELDGKMVRFKRNANYHSFVILKR